MTAMTLDVIDLGEAEQAVYEVVIARQPISLRRLAAELSARPEQLECAVQRLQLMGLISNVPGDLNHFTAAPPDIALEALLLEKEEQLKRARLMVGRLAVQHHRTSVASDATELLDVVSGRDEVLRRFVQAQLAGRTEIRIVDKAPFVAGDPALNAVREDELIKRGVSVREIYDAGGLTSHHQRGGGVDQSVAAGVDARVLPVAPIKMLLVDDRLVLIPLQESAREITSAVVVYPSALCDALSSLFEQLWERALPLASPEEDAHTTHEPTSNERRMLMLLTAGVSDEVIANNLGISHRTMQRRLRALLQRLGAHTRFQAALRAVAMGWLPAPPSAGGWTPADAGLEPGELTLES